jgi:signal transduction histidine kinase
MQARLANSSLMKAMWSALRWAFSPIVVFVALQCTWLGITIIWIIWFVEKNEQIRKLAESFGTGYFDSKYALTTLIIGCILLGMLSIGMIVLFVSSLRQSRVIQQQRSFVSSVTHELRSPLASLQLTLETLKSREPDLQTKETMIDMSLLDIQRLSRLVNQILVSARLDRGLAGFEDKPEVFNLMDIIHKVTTRMYWLDPKLADRLTIDCSEAIRLKSAPTIVSMVLGNLLENAIKYSPKNSPIAIRVICGLGDVQIHVEDSGFGIRKSDQKQIFRMFYRGSIATANAIPGTGLGLFMVKSLTRLIGGNTEVMSGGIGQGSTFVVTLPVGSKV